MTTYRNKAGTLLEVLGVVEADTDDLDRLVDAIGVVEVEADEDSDTGNWENAAGQLIESVVVEEQAEPYANSAGVLTSPTRVVILDPGAKTYEDAAGVTHDAMPVTFAA